jgi:hypothetical protein
VVLILNSRKHRIPVHADARVCAGCIFLNLFVMLFEEPALERKSGASYEEYLKSVPRWMRRRGGVHPRDAAQ